MSKKTHVLKYKITPFHTELNVIVSSNIKNSVKRMNKLNKGVELIKDFNIEGCGALYVPYEGKNKCFILFDFKSDLETMVHEIFHAVMNTAKMNQADWSYDSDEFYAYIMGSITQEVVYYVTSLEDYKGGVSLVEHKKQNKMKKQETEQMVNFGNYLLSDERINSIKNNPDTDIPWEIRAKNVTDSDLANFNEINSKNVK